MRALLDQLGSFGINWDHLGSAAHPQATRLMRRILGDGSDPNEAGGLLGLCEVSVDHIIVAACAAL